MYTMYQNGIERPQRTEVLDHLSGNLCRCTGYRPIIDAAQAMGDYPEARLDSQAVKRQLVDIRREQGSTTLAIESASQAYFAPCTADELAALYQAHPDAVLLAGGTDVGLWVTKQLMTLGTVIYLGDIADLNYVERNDVGLS